MLDVLKLLEKKDELATVAIDMFVYRIAKYIGAYAAAMNGVDAVVFTAGIGENCSLIRKRIMEYFTYLGIEIDDTKNEENAADIATPESKVRVLVIPTNEELVIAKDTVQIISSMST